MIPLRPDKWYKWPAFVVLMPLVAGMWLFVWMITEIIENIKEKTEKR